ncbi:MAG TPA: hypothetical protein VFY26_16310 [Anaerolineales bacterium]|nr:hypothetical protein [Anaerolineales bacterium]
MLFQATLLIDLLAMAATLWGAFYLFARGYPSGVTLRAVVVLLLLSLFFLGAYNNLFEQVEGTAAVRAVLLILGLGSWYSLTYQLMSHNSRIRLRWMSAGIYTLAAVTAVSLLAIPDAFIEEVGNTLNVAHMRLGYPYLLYGTFQIVIVLGILYNLLGNERIGLTNQGKYFLVASLFPGLAIISGIIGLAILPNSPRIIPDILIFSGIFLLGVSVARHQTMIERRTIMQEFPISLLTVLALAGLYAWLALRWGIPLKLMGAVVAFAVLTHSAYDLAREFIERLRIRRENSFRRQLRQLENQGASEEALQLRLQEGLDLLCESLHSSAGFIAIRRGERFVVIATRESLPQNHELSQAAVACDDISQTSSDELTQIHWLAPSFDGQTQVAVVALGKPRAKLEYSTGDLDLLADVAGQVGTIVSLNNRSSGRAEQIQKLVSEAQAKDTEIRSAADEMIATISTSPDAEFVRIVEEGLRHYSDYIVLGQSPLADWVGLKAGSHVERGKQLQGILAESIEALRPAGARPPEPLPRVWYSYAVLHDAYVEGVPNREIMARLYISEGTFNRTRRNAIRGLARLFVERAA